MSAAPRLSVVILALDEADHLVACLAAVAGLIAPPAGELVVILDGQATPAVEAIARHHTAAVWRIPFVNFSAQRNHGLAHAHGDWVLFLDPDERVTRAGVREIQRALAAPGHSAGYWVARRTFMFGHEVRHAGWWPDHQLRLLRRDLAHYDEARAVHEIAQIPADRQAYLQEPLIHYNYRRWGQFVAKQRAYAAYEARALRAAGVRAKPQNFVLQPLREFHRRFVLLAGWRDGPLGLALALAMAYYNLRMYLHLAHGA